MLLKDLIPINTILNDLGQPTCHYMKEIENEEREKIILKTFKALKEMGELSIDLDVEKIIPFCEALYTNGTGGRPVDAIDKDMIKESARIISKADIVRIKK